MATIKSFTSLEQSKKLAEFLPLEGADMSWPQIYDENHTMSDYRVELIPYRLYSGIGVPCWSLAALLGVLPILDNRSPVLSKTFDRKYRVVYHSTAYEKAIYTEDFDNPIDACVAMIEKLNELNLL